MQVMEAAAAAYTYFKPCLRWVDKINALGWGTPEAEEGACGPLRAEGQHCLYNMLQVSQNYTDPVSKNKIKYQNQSLEKPLCQRIKAVK